MPISVGRCATKKPSPPQVPTEAMTTVRTAKAPISQAFSFCEATVSSRICPSVRRPLALPDPFSSETGRPPAHDRSLQS